MGGITMPLVTSSTILRDAYENHYAVGAFNAHNLETAHAIIGAAEDEKAPVIVQASMGTLKYAGTEAAANVVRTAAEQAQVPVVLHLDHGKDFGVCVRCLRAGFSSLMFDGTDLHLNRYITESGDSTPDFETLYDKVQSREGFEENVATTARIVEMSHACGIPVEAELGKIPRIPELRASLEAQKDSIGLAGLFKARTRRLYAQVEFIEEFINRTGCDSLAVACGSIHGTSKKFLRKRGYPSFFTDPRGLSDQSRRRVKGELSSREMKGGSKRQSRAVLQRSIYPPNCRKLS
jgi:ketose-bisphosphate aldolase